MEIVISSLLSFLLVYKYIGLFVVSFLAAFLLPLPSSSVLAAAGAFSAQGYFSIYYVLIIAFVGNVCGDVFGYFVARYYGLPFLKKIGFAKALSSQRYITMSVYMNQFAYSLIFFSRFLTGVGPLVNIVSGINKLRFKIFFIIGVLGEIVYTLMYGLVGYFLGSEWENNISFLLKATGIIIFFVLSIGLVQYFVFKRMKKLTQS